MEELFLCPHCMEVLGAEVPICPVCGGQTDHKNKDHQLPVFSILHGRYVLGHVLGEGGFGITYIGYDLNMKQKVAIKEFYVAGVSGRSHALTVKTLSQDYMEAVKKSKTRFLDEAKTLAMFTGEPNIVGVRDYFEENNTAYIVMEFLDGEDLKAFLKDNGRQEFDTVFELLRPVMEALCKVQQKNLIHRDISPANIMLMPSGTVKLLDFGTTRVQSKEGDKSMTVALKHGFAPMEQYMAHGNQGPWTDVYAMTATFYQLLTGKVPPQSTTRWAQISMGSKDPLIKPSELGIKINEKQEAALLQGLAVNYTERIQTMDELIACLDEVKTAVVPEKPLTPVVSNSAQSVTLLKNNKKTIIIAACAIVLVSLIAFIVSMLAGGKASAQNTPAASPVSAQVEENDGEWVWEQQYNIVKEVYTPVEGEAFSDLITYTYTYDERGWEASQVYESVSEDYSYRSESRYEYDDDGNTISYTHIFDDGETDVIKYETRTVNGEVRDYSIENGVETQYSVYVEEDEKHRTQYFYTLDDELIEFMEITDIDDHHWKVESYDASGIRNWSQDTYEDEHGNTLKRENTYYDAKYGDSKRVVTYEYDNEQRIISGEERYYSGGDLTNPEYVQSISAEYELMDVLIWREK